jgi:hypothetical protein
MNVFLQILSKLSAGEVTIVTALVLLCSALVFFFYKEIKSLHKEHKKDMQKFNTECTQRHNDIYQKYKSDSDKLVKQMFEVTIKNTEANTKLAEAVRNLSNKL